MDLIDNVEPYATRECVEAWQQLLPAVAPEARRPLLVALAWHLRQRDTPAAIALADEAGKWSSAAGPDVSRRLDARLALVRAEASWLSADFDGAKAHVSAALDGFTLARDGAGCSDAHALAANIAADLGLHDERDEALARARECAVAAGDGLRSALVDAASAYQAAVAGSANSPAESAQPDWAAAMDGQLATGIPALVMFANDFRVATAFRRDDHGLAIPWLLEQRSAAERCGHVRKQIATAANVSMAFSMLNDFASALDWAQQSLDLARGARWPASIGSALVQTALILDKLDRDDAAQALLDESVDVLAPLQGAFAHLASLALMGMFAIKRGDAAQALRAFDDLGQRSQGHYREQFMFTIHCGRTRALALQGHGIEAQRSAFDALAVAETHHELHAQIEVLQLLAQLHEQFDLEWEADIEDMDGNGSVRRVGGVRATRSLSHRGSASASLHYLLRAQQVATRIAGFSAPDHLLAAIAEQYAKSGDHERAYAHACAAATAREAIHSREVRDLAMATQLRHETERARAESEHHRQAAESETRRALALSATLADLRVAQAELLRRNEVQARMHAEREETLAFVAHDLRSPLTAIVAALCEPAPVETLPRTARLAQRALTMTDRFLAIARLSRLPLGDRAPLDLASLIDEACETFERRAVTSVQSLDQDLVFGVPVRGHRDALIRAFCNLIDNALNASPSGGRVSVSMATNEEAAAFVIKDNGSGMPAAAQSVLMREAASEGKPPGERLGLSIVAEVARVHEARIMVDASCNGTRIEFWIPRV